MRPLLAAVILLGTVTACTPARPPAAPPTPTARPSAAPSAICQDGSASFARQRQGTCSQHGGVREWRR